MTLIYCCDIAVDCCVDNENEGNVTTELYLAAKKKDSKLDVGTLEEPRFRVFHLLQQGLIKVSDTYEYKSFIRTISGIWQSLLGYKKSVHFHIIQLSFKVSLQTDQIIAKES